MAYRTLTAADERQFLEQGFVVIRDCFTRDTAREWIDFAWKRMGLDRNDPAAWKDARLHLPSMNRVAIAEFAPRAWGAIVDLLRDESDIVDGSRYWSDGFIVNFNIGADKPFETPNQDRGGWHKDGDWFRHFLDSPEQALLSIVVWQDIGPRGGATYIAPDSIKLVAEALRVKPEGEVTHPFGKLIKQCTQFVEVAGRAGDVVLMNPFMLHTASANHSGIARFITNPAVSLTTPFQFNRANPADFSLVERKTLHDLGLERLDFKIAHERHRLVPERGRIQAQMRAEQEARLKAATK